MDNQIKEKIMQELQREKLRFTFGENPFFPQATPKSHSESDLNKNYLYSHKPGAPNLTEIRNEIGDCTRCRLSQCRKNIVFGEGSPNARLMFIGEGPGEQEDLQARPFVGKAGQLLDKIIAAMGLQRKDVYIGNVVKCRPPQNRTPENDEIQECAPFILRQIEAIRPSILVALGSTAVRGLLMKREPQLIGQNIELPKLSITRIRGQWFEILGLPMIATYHPAYLLRNPDAKKDVWQDMKAVMQKLKGGC